MIHPQSDVQAEDIGQNTKVWQFTVILEGARIGKDCNINCHVFIENDVRLGNRVTVKSGVQLWDGLRIADDVFIGPNVTFTNDKHPRSRQYPDRFQETRIQQNASIGAGAVVLGGVKVGAYALVGAGALVTKDVPDRALVTGHPAEVKGWVNEDGSPMQQSDGTWIDNKNRKWIVKENELVQL
ncbi:N-acetyltransferase [Aliifodinibius sp. S!AR15-10]|uniref:acyltransferase n=1 Tax=Aliifodinibius sp. S!AR15-10 TaxID=2950437 RepID=UPI00285C3A26|nr:acyltransferase [Aliifodinibius sp. S!AR15-10]MDR8393033.1 N-acetyltransferase [Aliifodinibius sp. S!AR15-10]